MHWLAKVVKQLVLSRAIIDIWTSQQPAWGRSREFDITTRSVGRNSIMQASAGDVEEEEEEEDLVHGRKKRRVQFLPSVGE